MAQLVITVLFITVDSLKHNLCSYLGSLGITGQKQASILGVEETGFSVNRLIGISVQPDSSRFRCCSGQHVHTHCHTHIIPQGKCHSSKKKKKEV